LRRRSSTSPSDYEFAIREFAIREFAIREFAIREFTNREFVNRETSLLTSFPTETARRLASPALG
jgi:hypothetical protein